MRDFELDHVACALARMADATDFLVGELGARPYQRGPGLGFRWCQWRLANDGLIEVLEPHGPPDGFLHRFLATRGPGVHHVTFKVPSLESAADHARRQGYEIVGWFDADPAWKECFLHPKQAQGIVVQLAEAHPELEDYPEPPFDWPAAPEPAAAGARLVGVHVTARDPEAARRQWRDTLGGGERERDGGFEYRWPGSPLRIRVAIDPGDEGPRAIELAADRRLSLPDGPHPVLGTVFRQIEDT